MTLYEFLKELTLTSYPVTASADVFVDDKTSLYLEAPVCQELPPYQGRLEFQANIVHQDSPLAGLTVICVAPYLEHEKRSRAELMVYVQMDRKTLESIRSQIDRGTLMGRYWNA